MTSRKPVVLRNGELEQIQSGDLLDPTALGTNTPDSTKVLYGDNTWRVPGAAASPAPFKLLIYYGTPHGMNGYWDATKAGRDFAKYDVVVLGDGLGEPADANYANTVATISAAKAANPSIQFFGYVDLGVTTQNLALATIQTRVNNWFTAGVAGIFFDDAGYDYQVSRSRLNTALGYAHAQGAAIVNAWNPDDVMGSAVNATYNPTGTATAMTTGDGYLLESWIYNPTVYKQTGWDGYASFFDIKSRFETCAAYRTSLGVKMLSSSVIDVSPTTAEGRCLLSNRDADLLLHVFRMHETAALVYGVDAYGISPVQYSASAPASNVVLELPYRADWTTYFKQTTNYVVNGAFTEVWRPDVTDGAGATLTFHNSATNGQQEHWCYTGLDNNRSFLPPVSRPKRIAFVTATGLVTDIGYSMTGSQKLIGSTDLVIYTPPDASYFVNTGANPPDQISVHMFGTASPTDHICQSVPWTALPAQGIERWVAIDLDTRVYNTSLANLQTIVTNAWNFDATNRITGIVLKNAGWRHGACTRARVNSMITWIRAQYPALKIAVHCRWEEFFLDDATQMYAVYPYDYNANAPGDFWYDRYYDYVSNYNPSNTVLASGLTASDVWFCWDQVIFSHTMQRDGYDAVSLADSKFVEDITLLDMYYSYSTTTARTQPLRWFVTALKAVSFSEQIRMGALTGGSPIGYAMNYTTFDPGVYGSLKDINQWTWAYGYIHNCNAIGMSPVGGTTGPNDFGAGDGDTLLFPACWLPANVTEPASFDYTKLATDTGFSSSAYVTRTIGSYRLTVTVKFQSYGWRLISQDPELSGGSYLPIATKHEPPRKTVSFPWDPAFNCSEWPNPINEFDMTDMLVSALGLEAAGYIRALPPYRVWIEPMDMSSAMGDFKFWVDRSKNTASLFSATDVGRYNFTIHIEFF